MTADEAYNLILYITNQYQNGEPSPDEYKRIIKYGQLSYMSFLLGQVEQQPQGRPIPRVSLGNNDHIYQSLSPFLVELPISVLSTGRSVLPPDFQAWDNMSDSNGNDIRFVQKDSWSNWKKSVIDPVTTNPIYTIDKNGFLFLPASLGSAVLTYYQTPPDSVWAFTYDTDGVTPIYDAANSVGLNWLEKDCASVIARSLKLVGINLQSAAVEQLANSLISSGQ